MLDIFSVKAGPGRINHSFRLVNHVYSLRPKVLLSFGFIAVRTRSFNLITDGSCHTPLAHIMFTQISHSSTFKTIHIITEVVQ